MSIINQALQKAQREQLRHSQQEMPYRLPTQRTRAPRHQWFLALLGLVAPPLRLLYDYAWFVGFGVAGVIYVTWMQRAEAPAENTELEGEA